MSQVIWATKQHLSVTWLDSYYLPNTQHNLNAACICSACIKWESHTRASRTTKHTITSSVTLTPPIAQQSVSPKILRTLMQNLNTKWFVFSFVSRKAGATYKAILPYRPRCSVYKSTTRGFGGAKRVRCTLLFAKKSFNAQFSQKISIHQIVNINDHQESKRGSMKRLMRSVVPPPTCTKCVFNYT